MTDERAAGDAAGRWGGHEWEPRGVPLRAGALSAELRGAELAEIAVSGRRLLRALKVVVRDHDWRTIEPVVEACDVAESADGVVVSLVVRHRGHGVDFRWRGRVDLGAGRLRLAFDGEALSSFRRNRIGLVVLHPLEDAGREATVISPDGRRSPFVFPLEISPHQPARDIAGFELERDGVGARIELAGDVFEMEDQRNWTDASFKTYSTPLDLPFPVDVAAGDRVAQSATITVLEAAAPAGPAAPASGVLAVRPDVRTALPELTVGASPARTGASAGTRAAPVLLVELDLDGGWRGALVRAVSEAAGRRLDVRLRVSHERRDAASAVREALAALSGLRVERLGVTSTIGHVTEPRLWDVLVAEARRVGIRADLVGGTRAHFTELNRRIDDLPSGLPALAFSITPQMHTVETEHVIDTIAAQRVVAENAVRLARRDGAERPVHIGPVTLRQRFNAVATSAQRDDAVDPASVDPRQRTPFAAAWTLASIAALTVPGVASVCYFEQAGPRGIASPDGLAPEGEVLAELSSLAGSPVRVVDGDPPAGVHVLPVETDAGLMVFVASLAASPCVLEIEVEGESHRVELEPASWARLDIP